MPTVDAPSSPASVPPIGRSHAGPPRVVVIDDAPEVRRAVRRSLRALGMEVALARSGEEGMRAIHEGADLVLTDVNMPGMDGFEVLSAIRGDARTAVLPVVLMTGRDDRPSMRRGMSLGADDYLTKPFTPDELRETVKARLDHRARLSAAFAERLERAEAALWRATHFDPETKLPNRTAFRRALERASDGPSPLAIIVLELDRFDRLLSALSPSEPAVLERIAHMIAARLASALGQTASVYRIGTSRYAVLDPSSRDTAMAAALAEAIVDEIRQPIAVQSLELRVTASAGVALWERGTSETPAHAASRAEAAASHARESGGNHVALYDAAIHDRAHSRLVLETSMHRALERDQLEVHYQPQVAARTGQLIGVEALVRWNHPELGMVSPFHFIPIAEETGLIVPIGEWVMRTACAQVARWSRELPGLRVAVNLSALQLRDAELVEKVLAILHETGLPPSQLKLELTESMMIEAGEATAQKLRALRDHGVHLSIDDFGTGYSSLQNLRSFPIGEVKIDRSFVRHVPDDRESCSIVSAVIEMAHELGLRVIAEGVEEVAQLRFLQERGCDDIQGYYYSKPLPTGAFLTWARGFPRAA